MNMHGIRRTKPVVIFVDGDPHALVTLERKLRDMRKNWDMLFYAKAEETFASLGDGPVDLVVADTHLRGIEGTAFFSRVAEIAPSALRFALVDGKDSDAALSYAGLCHQVLPKAERIERLLQKAQKALANRKLLPDEGAQSKVTRLRSLPARAEVQEMLVRELSGDPPSFEAIAALVSEDIALTAKVLQIASSGLFSADGETPGLVTAVSRLGVQRVKAVVRGNEVERTCAGKIDDDSWIEALWLHSAACATICQTIAAVEWLDTKQVENAFVVGLLHDIGRLAMAASEPALYREMLAGMAAPDSADGMRAETQIFKAAHPQIGAYLIGLWGFSDDIVQAVAHHHTPGEGTSERADLLAIVHAAEAFSTFSDPAAALSALDADYFRALGIDGKPEEWLAAVNLLAA